MGQATTPPPAPFSFYDRKNPIHQADGRAWRRLAGSKVRSCSATKCWWASASETYGGKRDDTRAARALQGGAAGVEKSACRVDFARGTKERGVDGRALHHGDGRSCGRR